MLTAAALSAALNVVILAGLPFLGDFVGLGSGGIAVTAALLYGVPERRGPDRLGLTLHTSPAPPAVSFPGGP